GNISLIGRGHGTGTSENSKGIVVGNLLTITAKQTGSTSLVGSGGSGTGNSNDGVVIFSGAMVTTGSGELEVIGVGGGSGASEKNDGIEIAGALVSTASGPLRLSGTGGLTTGKKNRGVKVSNGATVTSATGDVSVNGTGGGTDASANNHGVHLSAGGIISSTSSGNVDIIGTGGASTGDSNYGVFVENENSIIASTAGDINILTDAFAITPAGSITSGNNSSISIAPLTQHSRVLLGDDTSLHGAWLQLSDSELDQFNTPSLTIGNSTSGEIIVANNIIRAQATNVSLISAESIVTAGGSLDTGGGTLSLSSGNYGSLEPLSSGTDFTASTTTFGSDSRYQATINGTTVDTLYSQANIIGGVNLNSSQLEVIGGFIPQTGDTFTVINNDGVEAITGTFADLPEGAFTSLNGVRLQISYQGGTGNDVTLTAVEIRPTIDLIDDLTIAENSPTQTVQLAGIVAGSSVTSPLRVTASSSNTQLISQVDVTYTSNATTGSVSFIPEAGQAGTTVITVSVEDGGIDNDLSTTADNATTSTTFTVNVTPEYPWHNYSFSVDVNGDDQATPRDALLLINELNAGRAGELSDIRPTIEPPFLDVNKDGHLSPGDALQVINHLNLVNYVMAIDINATDVAGQPLSSVDVGSIFYLTLSSTDLRQDIHGVFSAYADVYYDSSIIQLAGTAEFHAPYSNGTSINTTVSGVIDEWGAFGGLNEPAGATVTISSIPVRAIKPGRIVFGIGEADIIPLHEALLYGNQDAIPSADIRFGSTLLEILGDDAEGEYVAAVDAVYESTEQFN
ncbi:MAG: dockerin type I domain-containing protein, partial [Pirellulaceae bacterium]|nr:dockerin type I domain-containing protein [Pirellulaceae bacterium]